mmetsp:Transcript_12784/g.35330  ORF Transcript_12784/g.35330 Transcript_12784/m.35330 type:complete len:269 (+) Transcript_12784:774-1580(+)
MLSHQRHLEQLVDRRSMPGINLQQERHHLGQVVAVVMRDPRVLSSQDLSVQTLHVVCAKRWAQRQHLVEHATEGPHVALGVVRHVPPNLWRCIVGRSCLRHAQTTLRDLGDVEISKLRRGTLPRSAEKDVRTLQVSVQDLELVQGLQPPTHSEQVAPDVSLPKVCTLLVTLRDELVEVSSVSILSNYTQAARVVVEESLLVVNHVFMPHGRKEPNLVQRIQFLLVRQRRQLHFLQGVESPVSEAQHPVHHRIGTLSKQRELFEVGETR